MHPKKLLYESILAGGLATFIPRRFKQGFTIAEMLITIAIIGVVAAIVIPSFLKNTNNSEYIPAWRKLYGTFSQAVALMANDNGGSLKNYFNDQDDFLDKTGRKIDFIKVCKGNLSGNCWHNTTLFPKFWNGTYRNLNWYDGFLCDRGAVLKDGSFFMINTYSTKKDCSGVSAGSDEDKICVYIVADINGFKPPNRFGQDIYTFFIHENKITPYYYKDDTSQNCNRSKQGMNCASVWLFNDKEEP